MLKVGIAIKNITPPVGVDLSGYAARAQPSTGKLDDLFARIICLDKDGQKIFWIHCDLVGFGNELAASIRADAAASLSTAEENVFLSATHTHSGPATTLYRFCGDIDEDYVRVLQGIIQEGVNEAAVGLRAVKCRFVEASLDSISRDRRRPGPSSHVDTALPVLVLESEDGAAQVIIANYAVHNVGLSHVNRLISADIAGFAAQLASLEMPGQPVVLVTNGGCGNINPIEKSDDYTQVKKLGTILGQEIVKAGQASTPCAIDSLAIAFQEMDLQLEEPTRAELEKSIDAHRRVFMKSGRNFIDRRVFEAYCVWYAQTKEILERKRAFPTTKARVQVLKLGPAIFVGVNMEVFSSMATQLRQITGHQQVYVVGYANGSAGYLAPQQVYDEGGYEVEAAHKFSGHLRTARGNFEKILAAAVEMIEKMS